jgi:hypothetical protein
MGVLGIVVAVALVGVAGVGGTAAYLYVTDYGLKADVTATDCLTQTVSVKTRAFGIDHDVHQVPEDQCNLLDPGDHVVYHIRSKHTVLYRGGEVCYDSETGPNMGCAPASLLG